MLVPCHERCLEARLHALAIDKLIEEVFFLVGFADDTSQFLVRLFPLRQLLGSQGLLGWCRGFSRRLLWWGSQKHDRTASEGHIVKESEQEASLRWLSGQQLFSEIEGLDCRAPEMDTV